MPEPGVLEDGVEDGVVEGECVGVGECDGDAECDGDGGGPLCVEV